MTEDPILTAARQRLTTTHATLYGRAWNIHEPEDLEAAAAWLAGEVRAVLRGLPNVPARIYHVIDGTICNDPSPRPGLLCMHGYASAPAPQAPHCLSGHWPSMDPALD